MSEDHPALNFFEDFLRKPAEPGNAAPNQRLVRHLLADCAPCQENLRIAVLKRSGTFDYSASFVEAERLLNASLVKEQVGEASPEELLAEMDRLPAEEQVARVSSEARFAFPGFVRHVVDASHDVRYRDPGRMLHLANLARLAAEGCSVEAAGSDLRRSDLRGHAWRQYGNALRVAGRLHEAEEAVATAQRHLDAGTRDPLLRAQFCAFAAASLRMSQRRFAESIELCNEAGEIYAELDDSHALASTLVQKAIALLYSGDAEEAVRALNQAIPLIEPERDPNLLLAACHNLVRCYIDLGRPEHALSIYSEMRDLYKKSSDAIVRLRASWQEGLLLRDLGHLRAAETALLEVRQGFVDRELFYDAALVSLDLSAVYVKLQAETELKQTIAESVPIFQALGVEREILASLLQLQQLAHKTRQALDLLQSLSSHIEKLPSRQTSS
ncbi:MAG: tetratricopeptide repeat protein [Thermoanaerobaculia bacterium]